MKNTKNLIIASLVFIIICLISANLEYKKYDHSQRNEIKELKAMQDINVD